MEDLQIDLNKPPAERQNKASRYIARLLRGNLPLTLSATVASAALVDGYHDSQPPKEIVKEIYTVKEVHITTETEYVLPPPDSPPDHPDESKLVTETARDLGILRPEYTFYCDDLASDDGSAMLGYVEHGFERNGQVPRNGFGHLAIKVCENFLEASEQIKNGSPLSPEQISASLVVAHESLHMQDVREEDEAQCYALQAIPYYLSLKDYDESALNEMRQPALDFHYSLGKEYTSMECRIGGLLDTSPGDIFNGVNDSWLPKTILTPETLNEIDAPGGYQIGKENTSSDD